MRMILPSSVRKRGGKWWHMLEKCAQVACSNECKFSIDLLVIAVDCTIYDNHPYSICPSSLHMGKGHAWCNRTLPVKINTQYKCMQSSGGICCTCIATDRMQSSCDIDCRAPGCGTLFNDFARLWYMLAPFSSGKW